MRMRPFNRPLFLCLTLKIKPNKKNIAIDTTEMLICATLLVIELFVFKIARIKEVIIPNRMLIIKDILKLDRVCFILITYVII